MPKINRTWENNTWRGVGIFQEAAISFSLALFLSANIFLWLSDLRIRIATSVLLLLCATLILTISAIGWIPVLVRKPPQWFAHGKCATLRFSARFYSLYYAIDLFGILASRRAEMTILFMHLTAYLPSAPTIRTAAMIFPLQVATVFY